MVSSISVGLTFAPERQLTSSATAESTIGGVEDQRENHRRHQEEIRISKLPFDQRQTAIDVEELRRDEYDRTTSRASKFSPDATVHT